MVYPTSDIQLTTFRKATLKVLGIKSWTNLSDYCKQLMIFRRLHRFTLKEMKQLQKLSMWCKQRRTKDLFEQKRTLGKINTRSAQIVPQQWAQINFPPPSPEEAIV